MLFRTPTPSLAPIGTRPINSLLMSHWQVCRRDQTSVASSLPIGVPLANGAHRRRPDAGFDDNLVGPVLRRSDGLDEDLVANANSKSQQHWSPSERKSR